MLFVQLETFLFIIILFKYRKYLIKQWLLFLLLAYILISIQHIKLFIKMFITALSFKCWSNCCQFHSISVSNIKMSYWSAGFINVMSFLSYSDVWIGGIADRKMRTKTDLEKERLKHLLLFLSLVFLLVYVVTWINVKWIIISRFLQTSRFLLWISERPINC